MSAQLPPLDPYAALEVERSAPQEEIAAAYVNLCSLLSGDELAAYGMLSPSELAAQREELDRAYALIDTPERRAAFDERSAGQAEAARRQARFSAHLQTQLQLQIQPPRGAARPPDGVASSSPAGPLGSANVSDLAAGPAVDGGLAAADAAAEANRVASPGSLAQDMPRPPPVAFSGQVFTHAARGVRPASAYGVYTSALSQELPEEAQFTGPLLRRLRESGGATLDDFSAHTKISRRYLKAIEAEDYSLLPAPAYVRGFVKEYAKLLGLEAKRVADSYLEKVPNARR